MPHPVLTMLRSFCGEKLPVGGGKKISLQEILFLLHKFILWGT